MDNKKRNILTIVLIAIILLIFLVLFFYLWEKNKSPEKTIPVEIPEKQLNVDEYNKLDEGEKKDFLKDESQKMKKPEKTDYEKLIEESKKLEKKDDVDQNKTEEQKKYDSLSEEEKMKALLKLTEELNKQQ